MRFVVFGAGAVGGVVGGRLAQHDQEVCFIARGEHGRAMAAGGLRLLSPTGAVTLPVTVAASPSDMAWRADDVVLLAVKSQGTQDALEQLSACAPPEVAVVCMQNGVANERAALRRFANVYGVCVICPAGHMRPGEVAAYSAPLTAVLDIGRFPGGLGELAGPVASAISSSGMESVPRPDIMRWKYAKLLRNLANAVNALCTPHDAARTLAQMAEDEGAMCLERSGTAFASRQEDEERRAGRLQLADVEGYRRGGSSSWQSLARATGTIEADYLNGEIVLLGRLHGVATPVNALLQQLANRSARERAAPATMRAEDVLALLPR